MRCALLRCNQSINRQGTDDRFIAALASAFKLRIYPPQEFVYSEVLHCVSEHSVEYSRMPRLRAAQTPHS
jgi:hypothetical protein